MTWIELAKRIHEMSDEQKDTDITLYDCSMGQCYPIVSFVDDWNNLTYKALDDIDGTLDDSHPVIIYQS